MNNQKQLVRPKSGVKAPSQKKFVLSLNTLKAEIEGNKDWFVEDKYADVVASKVQKLIDYKKGTKTARHIEANHDYYKRHKVGSVNELQEHWKEELGSGDIEGDVAEEFGRIALKLENLLGSVDSDTGARIKEAVSKIN